MAYAETALRVLRVKARVEPRLYPDLPRSSLASSAREEANLGEIRLQEYSLNERSEFGA
jgi:hypothetical protein